MRILFPILLVLICGISAANDLPIDGNTQFIITDDTVFDQKTGLRWKRCSRGKIFTTDGKCSGIAKKLGFFAAQKSIRWNSQEGMWRIPTRDEMKTIAGIFSLKDKDNSAIFPDVDKDNRFYWSSDMHNDGSAWYADLIKGGVHHVSGDYDFLDAKMNVRLVHVDRD